MGGLFISHSHLDKDLIVNELVEKLKNIDLLVWYDQQKIDYGESISFAISEGIRTCNVFLMVISENYNNSKWCEREKLAIISKCIGEPSQKMLIIQVDNAKIDSLISDIRTISFNTHNPESKNDLLNQINEIVSSISSRVQQTNLENYPNKVVLIVEKIFNAVNNQALGSDLILTSEPNHERISLQNEGVILIKPGGTFHKPCLIELLTRISKKCEIKQIRVYDGELIKQKNLFERQYTTSTLIARGDIQLSDDDYRAIQAIYNVPEFEDYYKVAYDDTLVVPALKLQEIPYCMDPEKISELWEQGRSPELFWNKKFNGLNKIGYQKTVFPIRSKTHFNGVRLALNGFIPGYKKIFESGDSHTIALRVSTNYPWKEIRDKLVGGKSNPADCEVGSIRRDAFEGKIKLDTADPIITKSGQTVNGQRNICHSSATLFDGMREINTWFDAPFQRTVLGKVLISKKLSETEIRSAIEKNLPAISWEGRDYSFYKLQYDIHHLIILDNLLGSHGKREQAIELYAQKAKVDKDVIRNNDNLLSFIENGLRLEVAGEEFFLGTLIEKLFVEDAEVNQFLITASSIKKKSKDYIDISNAVLAEAYRIAASDLAFLRHSFIRKSNSLERFRAMVFSTLPNEAIQCALRTHNNFIKDLLTHHQLESMNSSLSIHTTDEWKNFISQDLSNKIYQSDTDIIGLILAGGRSTRMSSAIPKAVLPFGPRFLFQAVLENLKEATQSMKASFFAAVGFQADLVKEGLGDSNVQYLEYLDTKHGLGFRVATCLETLAQQGYDGKRIILTYTDMPLVSSNTISNLLNQIDKPNKFGLLTSYHHSLSGHIKKKDSGEILQIIQQRLQPEQCQSLMARDVGVYIFFNTQEIRDALGAVRNDNPRKEFIFADLVNLVILKGWEIKTEKEKFSSCQSVNTAADLLNLVARAYENDTWMTSIRSILWNYYRLEISNTMDLFTLRSKIKAHQGPFYCFDWWDRIWSL